MPDDPRQRLTTSAMGQIHEAMVSILTDLSAVGKDNRNQQQGYNFRGIDDVCNELHPLMKKHGVYITPEVIDHKRETHESNKGAILHYSIVTVNYTFHARDGSKTDPITTIGEGMDSGDKASNKAMSAALKYALIQAFAIPTEEPKDSEHDSPQRAPARQQQPPARAPQRTPARRQQPAQQQPPPRQDWRETVTPQGKRMRDMGGIELATMEVTLSQRDELTENAEIYRQMALDGARHYALHSPDMGLVKSIADTLDHDRQRPDEREIVEAAISRLRQQAQSPNKPNA